MALNISTLPHFPFSMLLSSLCVTVFLPNPLYTSAGFVSFFSCLAGEFLTERTILLNSNVLLGSAPQRQPVQLSLPARKMNGDSTSLLNSYLKSKQYLSSSTDSLDINGLRSAQRNKISCMFCEERQVDPSNASSNMMQKACSIILD